MTLYLDGLYAMQNFNESYELRDNDVELIDNTKV